MYYVRSSRSKHSKYLPRQSRDDVLSSLDSDGSIQWHEASTQHHLHEAEKMRALLGTHAGKQMAHPRGRMLVSARPGTGTAGGFVAGYRICTPLEFVTRLAGDDIETKQWLYGHLLKQTRFLMGIDGNTPVLPSRFYHYANRSPAQDVEWGFGGYEGDSLFDDSPASRTRVLFPLGYVMNLKTGSFAIYEMHAKMPSATSPTSSNGTVHHIESHKGDFIEASAGPGILEEGLRREIAALFPKTIAISTFDEVELRNPKRVRESASVMMMQDVMDEQEPDDSDKDGDTSESGSGSEDDESPREDVNYRAPELSNFSSSVRDDDADDQYENTTAFLNVTELPAGVTITNIEPPAEAPPAEAPPRGRRRRNPIFIPQ